MNPMNRKMFRSRAARDKLNKMGGIMASSQPLMNTVQQFQVGGNVRTRYVPGQGYPPRAIPGTRPTVLGLGSGDLPTVGDLAQTGIGQFIARNLPTAANARRKISNIQEFIKPVRTAVGDFMTERDQRRAGGIETMRGPTAEDLKPVTPLTASEEALQAGQIPTMRGPTAADAEEAQRIAAGQTPTMRGPTAEDIRSYADRRTAGETETLRGPTAADAEEAQRMESDRLAGDILGDYSLISAAESDNPEVQTEAGKKVTENVTSVLQSEGQTPEEKNEMALEMLGLKAPGETLSKKEQIEKNKEFYREVFGTDPEKDKQIDGYNLAMMGFMIAAGDSPNALQNIAKGAAAGMKGFMDTAQKRQSREDKLTELAVADYQSQVKSDAAREEFRMNYNLKVQELLDKRDQAKTKDEKDRFNKILTALDDDAAKLAFVQLGDEAVADEKGLNKLLDLRSSIISRAPSLGVTGDGTRKPPSVEQYISDQIEIFRDPYKGAGVREEIAAVLGKQPEQVTSQDAISYFGQEYRTLGTAGATTPAPAGTTTQRISLEPDAE